MDGFDDLLASSKNALEDNPFADPFAQARSDSPDPWASFGQGSSHDQIDYLKSGFADEHSTASTDEQFTTPIEQTAAIDPLDVAARTVDDHEEDKIPHAIRTEIEADTTPHKPGFGIFTSSPDDHSQVVAEPQPLSRKSSGSSLRPTLAEDTPDTKPPLLSSQDQPSCSQGQSPIPENIIGSPLERSPSPGLSQAFSSVVLQDDAHGGWQSSWESKGHVPTFTSPTPAAITAVEDDDDDDDTPIGQTVKFRSKSADLASSVQVCALVNKHTGSLSVFSQLSRLQLRHVEMVPFHHCL